MAQREPVTRDSWKRMLSSAVAIFDELKARDMALPDVILGGGTVLMFRFEHRLSKDIDFFLRDVQWLGFLSPRLNEAIAAMIDGYEEQANSVKLIFPAGDIDFVAAGAVTNAEPTDKLEFHGYSFPLESTEEILAKKLLYRPASFKPRDVFDLAVAIEKDPKAAARAVTATSSRREVLSRRLEHLAQLGHAELAKDILPIGDFSRILGSMLGTVARFVKDSLRPAPGESDAGFKP
jgi:hypothetical protein